jgi:hypothetical protein
MLETEFRRKDQAFKDVKMGTVTMDVDERGGNCALRALGIEEIEVRGEAKRVESKEVVSSANDDTATRFSSQSFFEAT